MSRIPPRRCAVIGAGVLGASVAARLVAAGAQVTLLEQDQPGRATSRWSLAWLNSNDKSPRPYHDLNHAGIQAWAELAPGLDGTAWYRLVGHLELAATASQAEELAARVRRLTEWDYPAHLIDPAEAAALEPALRMPARPAAAAWFPGEGYLLTEPLIERLVARAEAHGATVLTGEPGRVTAVADGQVRTAAGATVEADEIVCCAGRWTPRLAELAGAAPGSVPLVPWDTPGATAPGFVVRAGPVAGPPLTRLVHTPDLALRPHPGGLLHLEAPDAAVDLHTSQAELENWADELLRRAQRTVVGLEDARVVRYQVCVRPMPADGQSIVGRLPGADHLYVAVTHSGVTLVRVQITTKRATEGGRRYDLRRWGVGSQAAAAVMASQHSSSLLIDGAASATTRICSLIIFHSPWKPPGRCCHRASIAAIWLAASRRCLYRTPVWPSPAR